MAADPILTDSAELVEQITKDDLQDIANIAGSAPDPSQAVNPDPSEASVAEAPVSVEEAPKTEEVEAKTSGEDDLMEGLSDLLGEDSPAEDVDALTSEEEMIVNSLPQKQKDAFISQRQEISQLKRENESLKGTEEGKNGADLQAKLDDMQSRLSQYEIVDMQEFKSKYDEPLQKELGRAARDIERLGGERKDVLGLAKLPLRDRYTAIQENYGEPGRLLHAAFSEVDRIMDERTEAINNAKETMVQMRAERAGSIVRGTETMDDAVTSMVESNHFLFKKNDNDGWNTKVDTRIEKAKALSGTLMDNPNEILLKAAIADEYLGLIALLATQRNEYANKFGKIRSSSPNLGSGGTTEAGSSRSPAGSKGRTAEEVAAMF